jgi:hypothetical protein
MARKAKRSKGRKATKHTRKKTKRIHAKKVDADNVSKAMKHAVAQTLATAIDHLPFDLGYSFK